jgi:hypothetical protein
LEDCIAFCFLDLFAMAVDIYQGLYTRTLAGAFVRTLYCFHCVEEEFVWTVADDGALGDPSVSEHNMEWPFFEG